MKKLLSTAAALITTGILYGQNPSPLQVTLSIVQGGLTNPVGVYNAGDERLFILEQSTGKIKIIDTLGTYMGVFLNISSLISTGRERGLLGLAFHPNYANNGFFYVNYTNVSGNTVIARYSVSANPNVANSSSAQLLMTINQPFSNHNGGHISFGPDGYLYIGMGDGGSGGDPQAQAQNNNSLLGKMLRIDVNSGNPYAIPPDNPFIGQAGYRPEIWATGLRNPWKFSFDIQNSDIWIGDVGQNAWEEIDREPAGGAGGMNWGWRCYEGNSPFNLSGCNAIGNYDFPIKVYSHGAPYSFCSITGGLVYRGSKFPGMVGHYFFSDYCNGGIYTLYPDGNGGYSESLTNSGIEGIVAFGNNSSGQIYLSVISGEIYKIEDVCGTFNPVLTTFNGHLSASAGVQYWWWKDGILINGANTQEFVPASSGNYYATVNNGTCTRQTNSITWMVSAGIPGCTYPPAINYDPMAIVDDGSCDFGSAGCTYFEASNYSPDAQRDDGSCIFPNTTNCPVDLNNSGVVDIGDLIIFIGAWGLVCN
ncbi:MAG: PQQ-dependent sugar dehydrogenase [Crocinitomicaceae bacterium]|nr:PQQ-dependent sugar dehydrogenase [Crocinitomicaceae bacterium]